MHMSTSSFMGSNEVLTIDQLVHQDDWVSDSERYRCHVCTRNFSSFRRKHHCRKCGEVVCRNCTLYKEAELPVIGRSKVRVCMSCMLNTPSSSSTASTMKINADAANRDNPQSPASKDVHHHQTTSGGHQHDESSWQGLQPSPTSEQDSDGAMQAEMNRMNAAPQYDYSLDYDWEHPWPKPPLVPGEAERLGILHSFDVLDTPAEDVFDIICDLASNALKCPIAAVSLIDEYRQWFKASVGLAQNEIPRNVAFCAHTIVSKEPLVVMDTARDERFAKNPLVTGAANIRFYAGAPICNSSGHILGTVFVFDTRPRDSCDIATLEKLSNVAMKNLEDRKNAVAAPVVKSKKISSAAEVVAPPQSMNAAAAVAAVPVANTAMPEQQLVAQGSGAPGADGAIVAGAKMENMLMDLLCRTTETQQQLATQQGAMFSTLGQHTTQIDKLADAVARMEAKLEEKTSSK